MSTLAIFINIIALGALGAAFFRNRKKALGALKAAVKMFFSLLPMLIIIIFLIGFLLGFIPSETLESFLGEQSGPLGVLIISIIGSVLHIPALLAFPLSASLLIKGASITVVAAFITTLTMIGMVTLPLEIRVMGKHFALLRNSLSFLAAIIISILMGVLI